MISLRVHQSFGVTGKWYNQGPFRTAGKFEPEGLAIKFLRLLNVVNGKTAERLVCVEHDELLDFVFLDFDAELALHGFRMWEMGRVGVFQNRRATETLQHFRAVRPS